MASHLNQPHFQDADKAREYLERLRWPNGPICPHCGSVSEDHYALKGAAHRPGINHSSHPPVMRRRSVCSDLFSKTRITVPWSITSRFAGSCPAARETSVAPSQKVHISI